MTTPLVCTDYTAFRTRNATRSGLTQSGSLPEIYPPHVIVADKHQAPCVGDYLLKPGSKREDASVTAKTMLCLDVDGEYDDPEGFARAMAELEAASERLAKAGVEHLYYSSYSHGRPKDGPLPYFGFRLVIPFARPMVVGECKNLPVDFKRLAKGLKFRFGLPGKVMGLSGVWYVPSVPNQAALDAAVYVYRPGAALDWTTITFRRADPPVVFDIPEYVDAPAKSVTAAEITGRLNSYYRRNFNDPSRTAWHYVANNKVPPLKDAGKRHDEIILPITRGIAKVSEPGESTQDLMSVMLPWIETMQEASPRAGNGWYGETLRALEGAMLKVPMWRAQKQAEDAAFIERFEAGRKARTGTK
jgi:hypothetical protein